MQTADILALLDGVKKVGDGWQARCPGHDDKRQSLTIAEGRDGTTVVKCHAGCTAKHITEAIGLSMRDLFPERQAGSGPAKPRIVARYDYHDERGQLLYQAVRYEPKDFRQRRPDGNGDWAWKLDGVRRVPFRLPALLAAPASEVVWVAEGEKDVESLVKLGLVATTNAGGAGKWLPEYAQALAGHPVVILPDNDPPGRKHAADVALSCMGRCSSIKVVDLPGLPPKGDVSDWLAAGGTLEGLHALVAGTPEWSPAVSEPEPEGEASGALELVYLSDRPPEPTHWLVGGILPEEACLVLGAEEKTGKSWLAFLISICLVTGKRLLGRWEPKRTGRVLIYSPESGWNARSQRLWGLCWGLGLDPKEVLRHVPFVRGRVDLASPASFEALRATVAAVKPVLLVLDPLIACYLDRDENSSGDVQPVLNNIRDLIGLSPGLSVLVAHHLNKANRERGGSPFHGLRGSSALGAWSDGLISLRKDGEEWNAARRIDVVHRDAASPAPAGFRIVEGQGQADGCTSFVLAPCDAPGIKPPKSRRGQNTEALVSTEIAKHPGEYSAPQIALKLGIGRTTVFDVVNALEASRLVHRDRFGKFAPGPPPENHSGTQSGFGKSGKSDPDSPRPQKPAQKPLTFKRNSGNATETSHSPESPPPLREGRTGLDYPDSGREEQPR